MNEQNLFLDQHSVNPLKESVIDDKTEILNVIVDDGQPSTDCALIGKKFEWKPILWMMHQKERISSLVKFRLVMCECELSTTTKQIIIDTLPGVDIEFIELNLSGSYHFYVLCAEEARAYKSTVREVPLYCSIGTMRLPRLLIAHWSQKHSIENIGYPALSESELSSFKHQISRVSDYEINDYLNVPKRFFGNLHFTKFFQKQTAKLRECRIAMVSEQPWFDHMQGFLCEKFTQPIANKCVLFFIGDTNDNQYITKLGFKSYIGFDYSALKEKNFIVRWTKLLDDNKNFFLDKDKNKEIYDLNRHVIEHNFEVLKNTDWTKKAEDEIEMLPAQVKEFLLEKFFKELPTHYLR
tara:strand:- start:142 stop:1197 length:1056 start_codon:yes stop_codon:yes gene_type:complete